MEVLNRIHSSADVKKLSPEELEMLAVELRVFLLNSVAKTGGHLASNLGAVELSLALHRVYDTSKDRLIFDVGHQSYVHKIITGRRERFDTLRQFGGISGFPKPVESDDDAFIAGHASNAISVAVGMAKARTLQHGDYNVVALLGDGALTGGLAYEGLAAAAASGEPMVIILNDNKMSIDPNVGGTARLLQDMRIRPGYIRFKRWYRDMMADAPELYQFSHRLKENIKGRVLPSNMFSAMGLNCLGPVDGHNIRELEAVLKLAKDYREPVLVHVITKKGKGVPFAEEHPEIYHGLGPFDPFTGEPEPVEAGFSDCFGETLCKLAEENDRLVGITAAMCLGTGMEHFASRFPDRFTDVGIAEGHATSMAAGMAKQGLIPVFAVYSSFLQRGFDMMIHDVSLLKLHVVFCIDRASLVGSDGETHHGIFDVSYLRTVPGMKIFAPASFSELRELLRKAVEEESGPVAIRYPRGGENTWSGLHPEREAVLQSGSDVTLVAYGTMIAEALKAAKQLETKGISAEVIKLSALDGKDFPETMKSLMKTGRLVCTEEVCAAGSLGTVLATAAAEQGIPLRARFLNLGEGIVVHGSRAELMRKYGIDAEAAVEATVALLGEQVPQQLPGTQV
ncbi:MAG: 1-deoxy-D-xylulose-5-phosphate synthase [Oscillospiraceae bacterium]|nr:1-deoxy-D-xylulose-5-phosphate synthase [Oscillospiraceae bacterium]